MTFNDIQEIKQNCWANPYGDYTGKEVLEIIQIFFVKNKLRK